MRADVIRAFSEAAKLVLAAEMGEPVEIGRPKIEGGAYHRQDVTAVIRLEGGVAGVVLFGMSREAARRYVTHVTGEVIGIDEYVQSAVAEMCNVIVGHAGRLLEERSLNIVVAPPTVVLGASEHGVVPGLQRLSVPIATPLGEVRLHLVVKAGQAQAA